MVRKVAVRFGIPTLTSSVITRKRNRMNNIKKIIIIGAGPAGLTAALRMQQNHQVSCIIYEIRRKPSSLGGAVGIPSNGLRLLQRLGIYSKLAQRGAETNELSVHSLQGSLMGTVDMYSWSKQDTGYGYLRIRRTDLMEVLHDASVTAGIPVHYGKHIVEIKEYNEGIEVLFSDGTTDTADFLLGCDGIHSTVRRLYVDPDCRTEYSGMANVYAMILTARLLPTASLMNGLHATLTSNGLFAVTPATAACDMLYWFFSREVPIPAPGNDRDGWEERRKAEVTAMKSSLIQTIGSSASEWAALLRNIIESTDVIKFYPIYKVPSGRPWFRGRCLLIGDAAHAMPPHASQGVSMALEDVFLFSKLLQSGCNCIGEALEAYEKKRKERTEQMLAKAENNGAIRKQIAPWRLWVNELVITGGLWVYKMAGLEKLGLGQKPLTYDVEKENFEFS